jgi:lysophospholipase L1-like esterase
MVVCLLAAWTAARGAEDFAIRDGDTVAFLGDSITAARTYGKIVENYTLLRYPQRKVRFLNIGIGGDTMAGGLKRLERDVFRNHVTLLTVAYGINDIGWGVHADEAHKRAYLDAVRGIVEACKRHGVRVYICSAAVTASDPNKSEGDFLQRMCDEGMALSRSLGGQSIDVQRTMRSIQKRVWAANEKVQDKAKRETLHAPDGIHLNELGQLAMAFAILKGLGAPADVSATTVDAKAGKLIQASGCTVSEVVRTEQGVEFTRLDEGLPLNYGLFFALQFRYVPIPDELNRYLLTVTNLPEERYEVIVDGRGAGMFTAKQLAAGVNIASTTADPWQPGGPWNAQANVLRALTESRDQLDQAKRERSAFLPNTSPTEFKSQAERTNVEIEELQRSVAKPRPYRFVIRPAKPVEKNKN